MIKNEWMESVLALKITRESRSQAKIRNFEHALSMAQTLKHGTILTNGDEAPFGDRLQCAVTLSDAVEAIIVPNVSERNKISVDGLSLWLVVEGKDILLTRYFKTFSDIACLVEFYSDRIMAGLGSESFERTVQPLLVRMYKEISLIT